MSSVDPIETLERELRILFRRSTSWGTRVARRIHPTLEASAYPLLAHIDLFPHTRGSDLAAVFGVGRATVSRQLSKLTKLGLIQRHTDPDDSRGQLLSLTEDGKKRLDSAQIGRVDAMRDVLADWAEEDVSTLATLLGRYLNDWETWQTVNPGK